jgi:hypothetical protein
MNWQDRFDRYKVMLWATSLVGLLTLPLAAPLNAAASSRAQVTYVRRAQAQVDGLTAHLREADQKLPSLNPADRAECEPTLRRLWQKEKLARVQLEAIKNASADEWQKKRKEEDSLLIRLQKSYQHLANHYFR